MNNDNRYFYDFVVADLFWKYETAGGLVRKSRSGQPKKEKNENTIMWRKNNVADYYHTGDLYCIGDSSRKITCIMSPPTERHLQIRYLTE